MLRNFRYFQGLVFKRHVSSGTAQKTSLFDFHETHKGKMVDFAGYYLPVQYEAMNITESHLHTRKSCSLFDVSHMLQTRITGKDRLEYFESLCTTDLAALKVNMSALSLFTDEATGGILDDLIVSKCENQLFVVSNASRRDHDTSLMLKKLDLFKSKGKDVNVNFFDVQERSLLALQGPKAEQILQYFVDEDLSKLYFMETVEAHVARVRCRITRCGYTGEDGFEISAESNKAEEIASRLLEYKEVQLAGLGARDTLRLEAGLCLYGNDIDISTTPVAAGLMWTIGKARKSARNFPGAQIIMEEVKSGSKQKRVGLLCDLKGPPIRNGCQIMKDEEKVGRITSGCPSPSLSCNIGMGYVDSSLAKSGSKLKVKVRNHLVDVTVTKMPFVPSKYYVAPKN